MVENQFNSSQGRIRQLKNVTVFKQTSDCCNSRTSSGKSLKPCIPESYKNKHTYMNNRDLNNNQIEAQRKYESRWKRNTEDCCTNDNKLTYSSSYVKRDKYELFNGQLHSIHRQNLNATNERIRKMVKMTKSDYMHTLKFPRTNR